MKKLLGLTLLLVSIAAPIPAPAQSFGELFPALAKEFPVTNTRYGAVSGKPQLHHNGKDFILFWDAGAKIRATTLRDDNARGGHVVLDAVENFDVVWTGTNFVVVGSRYVGFGSVIVSRLLDAHARPIGAEITLTDRANSPKIAVDRESILMLYRAAAYETRSLLLGRDGKTKGHPSAPITPGYYDVASNGDGFVVITGGPDIRVKKLNGSGQLLSEVLVPWTRSLRDVAVAGNQQDYLVAWCSEGEVVAATFDRNGHLGTQRQIEAFQLATTFNSASIAGNDTGWSVAYRRTAGLNTATKIAYLDREARTVTGRETVNGGGSPSLAALDGRRLVAWSPSGGALPAFVSALPLSENQPRVATYAASQQRILASASSDEGSLLVWEEALAESLTLRAGLRSHNGDWHEQVIATDRSSGNSPVFTATDGSEFVVLYRSGLSNQMLRLNEKGALKAPPQAVPGFIPRAITWNGEKYAVFGSSSTGRVIALLSQSGIWDSPVTVDIPIHIEDPAIASDGNGYLVTWENTEDCEPFTTLPYCSITPLHGARLGADLRRLDTVDIVLSDIPSQNFGVVRSGSEYVVAWGDNVDGEQRHGLGLASVPSRVDGAIQIRKHFDEPATAGSLARTRDGVAVALSNRMLMIGRDLSVSDRMTYESSPTPFSTVTAIGLADGSAAYAMSSVQDPAPHHGTSHVMMAIARSSPPPHPPHVHARLQNGVILVDWSPSAGTVNGYRLEYRVDGGSWNELEEWFPASANHRTIRPTFGTNFEIRMRAFNDGGASAYSATALTKPTRRRAAR